MSTLKISRSTLYLPLLATFFGAALEGMTVGLMVPILQSIVQRNVEIDALKIFDLIQVPFPLFFTSSRTRLLSYLITVLFVIASLRVLLNFANDCMMSRREQNFQFRLRTALFNRLVRFGKAFYDKHDYGALTNTVVNSSYELGVAYENVRFIIQQGIISLVYSAALFILSPALAAVSVLCLPWIYLVVAMIIQKVARASKYQFGKISQLNQQVSDSLQSIPLMKAYSMEARESARFEVLGKQTADLQYSNQVKMYFMSNLQEITSVVLLVLLVFTANLLISKYDSTAGSHYLVFFYVLRRVFNSLNGLTLCFARIARAVGYIEKAQELLDEKGSQQVLSGTIKISGLHRGLEFRALSFAYGSNEPVLRDLSFTIRRGEMVALVGPSGAGKSTILQLIQRLYDVEAGTLFVDGRDIRDLDTESFLKLTAIVSQDVFLFNNTIRYNLSYGLEKEPSEMELWRAIKQAELTTLVQRMPQGLDTKLGERGVRLSGGERQRVSIARAMLKNAQLLLLDEATSSLDVQTEASIQHAFDKLLKNRTCVVVAHRLSTIQHADKIIVIENGRLVEEGTFRSLLKQKGRFHRLHSAQKFAA